MLAGFDLVRILPETVLFQAGYLTISRVEEFATGQRILTLDFPNQEVRVSLNKLMTSTSRQDVRSPW